MSNNWVNPYLDMFQDQFVCQYAYSLVASDPALDATDHLCLWQREAHKCATAAKRAAPSSSAIHQKPAPEGMICGMSRIPVLLSGESTKPRTCSRCGRTGLVRQGVTSVTMSNRTVDNPYQAETEYSFCRFCTNTGLLSEEGNYAAVLCVSLDRYVVFTNPALLT